MVTVTAELAADFARDGAVVIRGLWDGWVETLRAGVERNMADPGQPMPTLKPGEQGRFFDDYCNWRRIPEFRDAIFGSGWARWRPT